MKFIKCFLLITAMFLAVNTANAQVFGAKAGFTFSKIIADPDLIADDLGLKPGVQFGVMLSLPLIPMFDIQPEVVVFQKGAKYSGEMLGVDYMSKTDVFSVDVPINLKFSPPVIPIYIVLGPYFGYNIQGQTYTDFGGFITESDIEFKSDGFRPLDFGINAGVGFMKDFGPVHFFAEARYNYGVLDIDGSSNSTMKNSNFGIAAGVLLGKK